MEQEKLLRKKLKRNGYALRKSRIKIIHADNFGGYMIVDTDINAIVAGSHYDLDLEDVAAFVNG